MLKRCQQISTLLIQERRPAGGLRTEIQKTTAAHHQTTVLQQDEKTIGWDFPLGGTKVPLVLIVHDSIQQIDGDHLIIK